MDTFTAIAEPSRRRILEYLAPGAQPVNMLVNHLEMSQPVVSKHLRILREAGLVTVTPDGQRRLYSINPAPLEALDVWLAPYRQFWSNRLMALEEHLEEGHS